MQIGYGMQELKLLIRRYIRN